MTRDAVEDVEHSPHRAVPSAIRKEERHIHVEEALAACTTRTAHVMCAASLRPRGVDNRSTVKLHTALPSRRRYRTDVA